MRIVITKIICVLASLAVIAHFCLTLYFGWEAAADPAVFKLVKDRIDVLLAWFAVGVAMMFTSIYAINVLRQLQSDV